MRGVSGEYVMVCVLAGLRKFCARLFLDVDIVKNRIVLLCIRFIFTKIVTRVY